MFEKILIANRGEIAVRIIRACKEMGIKTVAVYSCEDKDSLHVKLADEAVCIGEGPAKNSYLNMESILSATIATKANAIHPGFGFLSENSRFAMLCEQCNIVFIGPDAKVMDLMGNKSKARETVRHAEVSVVPGTNEAVYDAKIAKETADEIGYPVIIKASAGGGGKGMRVAFSPDEFEEKFETAQSETRNAFADEAMYVEKYIESSRHIEFQILADMYGNVIHLGERECSIQRRHQKMIEESPSVAINDELREKMGNEAVRAAAAAGYYSAGTVEFILDKNNNYYFIEMNTRIQVEHGVTELITGIDLIKEQIKIAAGEHLSITQEDVKISGHAIECRINAEDPDKGFMPCPGKITTFHMPGGNGIRIDTALYEGYKIPSLYDSLVAKVMVYDDNRQHAIAKMKNALDELEIGGVTTNSDFQEKILDNDVFVSGSFDTGFIENVMNVG